jgi:FlaA1/EpsC-like NDP-sugar epimerase
VLGATKLAAERLTAQAAKEVGEPYLSVRFGNVLGSRGSVLPIFLDQLENGNKLTVTDPDVTRYFMTIPEAVRLVVQAGAIGDPGEVLVLAGEVTDPADALAILGEDVVSNTRSLLADAAHVADRHVKTSVT